jgi:catechol 2,3-dioxygenase-like lactoylglutathione lyase family enzyme
MTPRPITHLRHVAVAVPRFRQAVALYEGVCGLRRIGDDGDLVFLGTDVGPEQYILRLRRSPDGKRVDLISLAAPDASAVDGLAQRLAAAGTRIDREPGPLGTPGGGYGFRFFDPEGRLLEVSCDVAERSHRPAGPREPIPGRLSHIVLNSTDIRRAGVFYERHLGFRVTGWLEDRMCFLRCNTDHHTIAFAQQGASSLNHVAFELRDLDACLRGAGRIVRAGRQPLWGPGRHGAGGNVFTYFEDPNGNVFEYTCAMEQIPLDRAWEPRVWPLRDADVWGTAGPGERLSALQARSPADAGLWTPSPV